MLSSFQARESRQRLCVFIFSQTAGSQTKTTNRLFSKKSLGRVTNKNDKPFNFKKNNNSRVTNKNDERFIFQKTAGSQTKTTNRLFSKKSPQQGHKQKRQTVYSFIIQHSPFGIQYWSFIIRHSCMCVCMQRNVCVCVRKASYTGNQTLTPKNAPLSDSGPKMKPRLP